MESCFDILLMTIITHCRDLQWLVFPIFLAPLDLVVASPAQTLVWHLKDLLCLL